MSETSLNMEFQEKNNYSDVDRFIPPAKIGDSAAFGSIYEFFVDKIYRFVYFKTSNKQIAEDLTQQAFMNAWRSIGSFKDSDGKSFSNWIFRIARNAVIDFYRKNKSVLISDIFDESLIKENSDFKIETDKKFLKKDLLKAIGYLSDVQKEIIILKFINDLDNKEIAEIIGKSEGNIRIIQYRALKNLRKIMKEELRY